MLALAGMIISAFLPVSILLAGVTPAAFLVGNRRLAHAAGPKKQLARSALASVFGAMSAIAALLVWAAIKFFLWKNAK
jgi:hypothetical protein